MADKVLLSFQIVIKLSQVDKYGNEKSKLFLLLFAVIVIYAAAVSRVQSSSHFIISLNSSIIINSGFIFIFEKIFSTISISNHINFQFSLKKVDG
jgi:hypothetical protein